MIVVFLIKYKNTYNFYIRLYAGLYKYAFNGQKASFNAILEILNKDMADTCVPAISLILM